MSEPKEGDLKVWHVPQMPCKAFEVEVYSLTEAKRIINVLADYDLFQFDNKIKPDYCNASGLSVYLDGEWVDWLDENGDDIHEVDDVESTGWEVEIN